MALWIGLAILSQCITAAIVLIDKYVLVRGSKIGEPVVYAFYVSLLSGVVVVLLPFGVGLPSAWMLFMAFVASITFVLAILHLYRALKRGHASDAVPVSGATAALVTALLASMVLSEDLPRAFIPAFLLMVIGTFLIAHFRLSWQSLGAIVIAGCFFGVSAIATKLVFIEGSFLDAFFWSRMTNVAVALSLLIVPDNRRLIFHGYRHSSRGMKSLVLGNKILGGISAYLYLIAISLGSVSLVQAMSGLQFAFLLLFAYFSARWLPQVFKGEIHPHQFPHQVYGVICIIAGLAALFLVN